MTTTVLIASAIAAAPIIKDDMTEAERIHAISPFLHPSPGEFVSVDPTAVKEKRYKSNPMLYKLYVTVKPPKGHCFTITRNPAIPDKRICEERKLAAPVGEVSESGQFSWKISTGKGDFGHHYTWNTPHRIIQKIPAGTRRVQYVPILSCTAHPNAAGRRLILNLMDGERWAVTFPPKDQLEEQPAPLPNLFIADGVPSGGITENSQLKVDQADPWAYLKAAKPDDPVTAHWAIPPRNHFRMGASNFKITDTAPGMRGTCRYQYTGAAKDPESGWIECHETDMYDVIFTHLTCSKRLVDPPTK